MVKHFKPELEQRFMLMLFIEVGEIAVIGSLEGALTKFE